jgi:tetratricopeptide (TPR) repeat protein
MRRLVPGLAIALACAGLALRADPVAGQAPPLVMPKQSPRAMASQTIGLTDITITYDRPGVDGREVWGKLVPFDSVWRAGANENTVIAFSSPVMVAGQEVPAGRYGLHMIPSKSEWQVALSRQANQWGSFSYDPKEDLLRVKVTPVAAEPQERLAYTFDAPGADSVLVTLRWEKLAVPIPVKVNTKQVVMDSLRQQLRGLHQFFWQPWSQAAAWANANDIGLPEATEWAQRSIAIQENFTNLRVKAALLEKQGDATAANELRKRSFELAGEADMNTYGYQLLAQGKTDSAIAVFKKNTKDYPRSWNTYDSLGEALAKKGDKKKAVEAYTKARSMTEDPTQRKRIDGILAGL